MRRFEKAAQNLSAAAGGAIAMYIAGKAMHEVYVQKREERRMKKINSSPIKMMAHTAQLFDKAMETNSDEDKITALESANRVDRTPIASGFGANLLSMLLSQQTESNNSFKSPRIVIRPEDYTAQYKTSNWISPERARALKAVNEALGGEAGTNLIEPKTFDEYQLAASTLSSPDLVYEKAAKAQSNQWAMLRLEMSVPGTQQRLDIIRLLSK